MQRADGKRSRLALLPSEPLCLHDIEGDVDDVEQAECVWPRSCGLGRPQGLSARVVAFVEAGEMIGVSLLPGGTEIAADKPITINRVPRETIDVDILRRDRADCARHNTADRKPEQHV